MTGSTGELRHDRASGALLGVALGDALGMPTQSYSPAEIAAIHGEISDFVPPAEDHEIAHGLVAASVTDDTEQTILLARQLLDSPGSFDELAWAQRLLDWETSVRERGLHDLLGPSTKRALKALLDGVSPEKTGLSGDTNGAAMRIAPVGISTSPEGLPALISQVEKTCRITHNTAEAIATASAVAAAISAGIDGADVHQAGSEAVAAARMVEINRGADDRVAQRLSLALQIAEIDDGAALLSGIRDRIGTSVASVESVPAAFAIFRFSNGDAWRAGLLAANLGGDTDTIGAIACGMCGAVCGASSLPSDKIAKLAAVNGLHLDDLATQLLALRLQGAGAPVVMGQMT